MNLSFKASYHREGAMRFLQVEEPFQFASGGSIPAVTLAFETWGELNEDRSNAVLILTGLSPNAHAASSEEDPTDGWWEPMIGPGKAIDTNRHYVICVNSLGSCQGSTGPGCVNPVSGKQYRLSFPDLVIQDIANAAAMVLEYLQIEQLRALVGPSMGGMSCLALLRSKPDISRHFLAISTAARAEPFAIAVRSLQREIIVRDPHWQDGAYTDDDWPETGMRLARKLGMISYRSEPEWRERFGREEQVHFAERLFGMHFSVESYLENAARKFIRNFDPCCYLFLSQSIDWFDLSDGYADMEDAFSDLKIESAKVIGVHTDFLWPPHQQKEIADCFAKAGVASELQMLDSIQGHDSFMVDYDRFCPAIAEYMNNLV
ncbi:MAG: homoserine O-acetyltransferase [Xanthomonadales bacterium]|jgi:homoserine O-acetyltransferase|nr:homoserine O-acetyltransferase [Xanthomonadales bacterium]